MQQYVIKSLMFFQTLLYSNFRNMTSQLLVITNYIIFFNFNLTRVYINITIKYRL